MSVREIVMMDAGASSIEDLVKELASKDVRVRTGARKRLVEIGKPAVGALMAAFEHPQAHMRWEAAKTLAGIADPAAIPCLIDALQDSDQDVRWVAGEALIAIGRDAVRPILETLRHDREHPLELYENAHHVLHALAHDALHPILAPVLEALKSGDRAVTAPLAAGTAISALDSLS